MLYPNDKIATKRGTQSMASIFVPCDWGVNVYDVFSNALHVTNLITNFQLGTHNHNPLHTIAGYALCKTRTQLGPSSSLDYRAGFTLSKFYTTF